MLGIKVEESARFAYKTTVNVRGAHDELLPMDEIDSAVQGLMPALRAACTRSLVATGQVFITIESFDREYEEREAVIARVKPALNIISQAVGREGSPSFNKLASNMKISRPRLRRLLRGGLHGTEDVDDLRALAQEASWITTASAEVQQLIGACIATLTA